MHKLSLPLLLCSMLYLPSAMAASQMKPGLWEMTIKPGAPQNLPKLSPEQKERMRKSGVDISQLMDKGLALKFCATKEMVESDPTLIMERDKAGCEAQNYKGSSKNDNYTYSADVVCKGPVMKGEGKVNGVFTGHEQFTSTYLFNGTRNGRPVQHHRITSGQWLADDCGKVAPMSAAKPAK